MAVYLNENFDSTTLGSLPTGWSSLNGTAAVSNTVAYSGTNSLKLTGSNQYVFAWKATATDSNQGQAQASVKFFFDTTPTGVCSPFIYLLCTSAPAGANMPPLAVNSQVSVYSGGTGIILGESDSTGASNSTMESIAQGTFSASWASSTWYQMTLAQYWSLDGIYKRLNLFVQRLSDGAWLHRDGTWQTGAQTAVLVHIGGFTTSNFPAWANGTFCVFGAQLSTGVNMYLDDCLFETTPTATGASPSNPPAAGNEVELIPTITTSDAGQTGQGSNQINTTNFEAQYISLGAYDQWILLDAGLGKAATPTALLFAPGWSDATYFFSNRIEAHEAFSLGIQVEGANSTAGPWTFLGSWATDTYAFPHFLNTLRLDPANPGGSYRYIRLRAPLDPVCVSQVYLLVQNSGGVSWKPARPIFSPAGGNLPTGGTVTITTQTSGASIYFTTDGTTPTTSSTLYTGPITLPANSPAQTTLKAIAYHASGTTTTSAVTTGYYQVPGCYVFDSGITGATLFGTSFTQPQNWPGPLYDTDGFQLQTRDGGMLVDSRDGTYWLYGNWLDTLFIPQGGTAEHTQVFPRGTWFYKGVSIQGQPPWLNWQRQGQLQSPVPANIWPVAGDARYAQNRPHILQNPNPLDTNKRFILWMHYAKGNTANSGYVTASAPEMSGPWTWQGYVAPGGQTSDNGDHCLFYDPDVDDGTGHSRGKAYLIHDNFVGGATNDCHIWQLDPTTDWLTLTGTATIIGSTNNNEGFAAFKCNGSYYILSSPSTPYGSASTNLYYVSATTFPAGPWAGPTSLWKSHPPSSPSVAYAVQPAGICQIPNLPSPGFILILTVQDPFESTIVSYHMWQCMLPLSTITSGNSTNAFPSAGTLSVVAPAWWTAANLPGALGFGSCGRAARFAVAQNRS